MVAGVAGGEGGGGEWVGLDHDPLDHRRAAMSVPEMRRARFGFRNLSGKRF